MIKFLPLEGPMCVWCFLNDYLKTCLIDWLFIWLIKSLPPKDPKLLNPFLNH